MCRNIRPLFNFEPPATDDEVDAAALQFVRKISGFQRPSAVNQQAFDAAVAGIATGATYAGEADPYTKPREADADESAAE